MATVPPPVIEQRLSALIPRVRALHTTRGAARLILAAVAAVVAVVLLDLVFALPAWVRGLFLSVWLTGFGVFAWRWVIVPWRAEISLAEVAREVEKKLPELGERLRTAVTKNKSDSSIAVQAALLEDTARRTKLVDLNETLPLKPTAKLASGAVAALLAVVACALLIPGSLEQFRRVALPWSHNNGKNEFRIHVTSGELVVKRGGSVTLSAYTKHDRGKPTPNEGTLILRDVRIDDAPERRESMTFDGTAFHTTFPSVLKDFDYCIEVGNVRSEWFRVTAVDAVELAEGTSIEISPPAYTKRQKHSISSFTNLEGLQFSSVEFRLKFNRPAAFAQLDWRPDGSPSETISLTLTPDRLSASANFRLRQNGVLKLLLDGEGKGKKLRTETPVAVRVIADVPPWFEQLTSVTSQPRTARPTDRLRIEFAVCDDSSVSSAMLEYTLDSHDSKIATVPMPFAEKAGSARVSGVLEWALADEFKTSETIRFRVRITDNLNLDDPKLGPQETVYPPSGWSELKRSETAPPLDQQDVVCHRDTLRDGLTAASHTVGESLRETNGVRSATNDCDSLAFEHKARLSNLRLKITSALDALLAISRDAALTPELRPLAEGVHDVAEQLKNAVNALHAAETDNADSQKQAFNAAAARLNDASGKLSDLLTRNSKFAQDRLDRMKLNAIAVDQIALADALKAGGDVTAKQRELLARLEAIITESDALKTATQAAKAAEVRRLAQAARELANTLRELDRTMKKTTGDARAVLVEVISRDQNALAKQTAVLFGKLETPCRLAGMSLPKPDNFLRVADLAAAGKTVDALSELVKHAQALEGVATAFDTWSAERRDPKFAVKQLALWQDDLFSRFTVATKEATFAKLPPTMKDTFCAEQKALDATLKSFLLPSEVKDTRANALIHTDRANKLLAGDGTGADRAMKLAVESLNLLADRTPTVAQRLAKSLRALDAPRQELEQSGNAIDLLLKGYESKIPEAAVLTKKFKPHADRQQKLIAAITALDLPGLSERQSRVVAALNVAVADMQDGSFFDVQASQASVRREFERLKFVLEGSLSPDAKAEELAHKLAALADSLDTHGPNLTAKLLEPAAPVLQDVAQQLSFVVAPEAPALLNDARVAVQVAEVGLRDAKFDEVRRRIRVAADALAILSNRLNGFETDLEHIQRIAILRRFASEKPKEIIFSDEAVRQLGRELDELISTRVGFGGQSLKKRAIDLYAKIRAKTDLDLLGTDLKTLATTLDELGAKMADVSELATIPPRSPVPSTFLDADHFLPSKPLADAIRALARQQQSLHAQVTNLAAELTIRLKPSLRTSSGRIILSQIAHADEIARNVKEFAVQLEDAARTFDSNDVVLPVLREVAKDAKDARNRIAEATKKAAEGNTSDAEKLRTAAEVLLRVADEKLTAISPQGAAPALGESLRTAERSMRKAILQLEQSGDSSDAQRAMRDAAKALRLTN